MAPSGGALGLGSCVTTSQTIKTLQCLWSCSHASVLMWIETTFWRWFQSVFNKDRFHVICEDSDFKKTIQFKPRWAKKWDFGWQSEWDLLILKTSQGKSSSDWFTTNTVSACFRRLWTNQLTLWLGGGASDSRNGGSQCLLLHWLKVLQPNSRSNQWRTHSLLLPLRRGEWRNWIQD